MAYKLRVRKYDPDQLVLGFGVGWRCFFGALGLLMIGAMIREYLFPSFMLVVTVILFLAAFYSQRWVFDRHLESIVHSSGLLFAHRTRRYSLPDLQEVFVRGLVSSDDESREPGGGFGQWQVKLLNRGVAGLWLRFAKAGAVEVELDSNRNAEALRELGAEIARFCDVPYRGEAGP